MLIINTDNKVKNEKVKLKLQYLDCPFCGNTKASDKDSILHELQYSKVHRRFDFVEDFKGQIQECEDCGVFLINPRYDEEEFDKIYTSLCLKGDKNNTFVKTAASFPTKFAMKGWFSKNPIRRVLSRFAGWCIDRFVHMPIPSSLPERGANILDVGAGDGFHLRCFDTYGAKLYATEIHPDYAKYFAMGPEKIKYWIKEFCSIDWDKEDMYGKFDLIIFQSVYYRLNNPKESMKLSWNLLKPGGIMLRIEPFCHNLNSVKEMTKFNFPQGFNYIKDVDTYLANIKKDYPDADFKCKIYYGRSHKLKTGNELNIYTAAIDVMKIILFTIFKVEPNYIKIEMVKRE